MFNGIFSKEGRTDALGILMSCLCCIHCMAAPLLIIAAPWTAGFFENEFFHIGMILFVAPTAYFAFSRQYKKNKDIKPVIFGVLGVLLIVIGVLIPELEGQPHTGNLVEVELHEHKGQEIILTVIGSAMLLTGHFINLWNCRCKTCHH